ncbi:hypothetical protein TNCV_3736211 [Trichonephila clavipes]|nr:hypothetical protein TNCV_3736211 [Trichonephila clavipes]
MKAVSVLEHFSDHGSIHQKMKKNTTSVRSYPNSAGDANALNGTAEDTVWKNDDAGTNSEVSCNIDNRES